MRLTANIVPAVAISASLVIQAQEMTVTYKGSGWIQFGRIEHSSDTVSNQPDNNFNGNWIQSTGGQITAIAKIGDSWEGGVGVGAIQTHSARGAFFVANQWAPFWAPLIEARVTHTRTLGDAMKLQFTLGNFPYNYNPDVKNLGLYLIRGQAYPGTVISGFETKHVLPIASIYGGMIRFQAGKFQNDILLNSETEAKPLFDFSLADVMNFQVMPGVQFGAGVNFYRLFPQIRSVTSPGTSCYSEGHFYHQVPDDDPEACYSLDTLSKEVLKVDTAVVYSADGRDSGLAFTPTYGNVVVDTVTGSMAGTKVMARLRVDPKVWFGSIGSMGKDDLVLYSEAAILGVENQGKYFKDITRRIPIMVGFNFPAFNYLDKLSLEVEYYGSMNYSDYGKAESFGSWVPRSVPGTERFEATSPVVYQGRTYTKVQTAHGLDYARDNWKWSLYGTKVIMSHLRLAAQIANDHYRNNGTGSTSYPTWAEALTTPKDWYWMCKLAYFF
ncbi:MAG TPA: hypothetical protein VJ385_10650 [Fibrobacteria bacterium]|nr:hypothetical protein [Fibrobacteria bacterium]